MRLSALRVVMLGGRRDRWREKKGKFQVPSAVFMRRHRQLCWSRLLEVGETEWQAVYVVTRR